MESWDGAELSLLRETIARLVDEEECRSLGLDMSRVKHLPSGYFGMLYDWHERGVCIRVFGALPQVKQMLWFTTFFCSVDDDCHELRPTVECEGGERFAEHNSPHERLPGVESPSPADDPRESDIPFPGTGKADRSERSSLLSQ